MTFLWTVSVGQTVRVWGLGQPVRSWGTARAWACLPPLLGAESPQVDPSAWTEGTRVSSDYAPCAGNIQTITQWNIQTIRWHLTNLMSHCHIQVGFIQPDHSWEDLPWTYYIHAVHETSLFHYLQGHIINGSIVTLFQEIQFPNCISQSLSTEAHIIIMYTLTHILLFTIIILNHKLYPYCITRHQNQSIFRTPIIQHIHTWWILRAIDVSEVGTATTCISIKVFTMVLHESLYNTRWWCPVLQSR